MATTTVQDEYMPLWVKQKPLQRAQKKVEIIKGQGDVQNVIYNNKKISFTADITEDSLIQVNTIYWPGWSAFIDGKRVDIRYNNPGGVMQFSMPSGKYVAEAAFSETPIRIVSDFISILSLLILIVIKSKKLTHNNS
jgi:uncharacterized membrane protein YfhO